MVFLHDYTMLDELGRGGFAIVYKVRHNELGYIRAIRVLNETIIDKNSKTYQNFLRECRVLLRLGNGNHPNIVHIYRPDLLDNKALVEMDYVDGMDILHYLKKNDFFVPAEEVIRMATQMSSALAYCHENIYRFCMDRNEDNLRDDPDDGSKVLIDEQTRKRLIDKYKVIHNDIHSGNIMRRENGNFILLDFGLAINGGEVVHSSSRHTNGAPEFKAPEKWDNETTLTEQSDIYSFGIVLYQYLAGRVPFVFNLNGSKNRTEAEYFLSKEHQEAPPPLIEPLRKERYERKYNGQEYKRDYPFWLEEAIMKCLNKDPKDRFRNGQELYEFIIKNIEKIQTPKEDDTVNQDVIDELESMRGRIVSLGDQLNEKQNLLQLKEQDLHKANEKSKLLEEEKRYFENQVGELEESNKLLNRQLNEKQNMLLRKEEELRKANDQVKQLDVENKNLVNRLNFYLGGGGRVETKRFCRRCGAELSPNAKFCKVCGSKVG